MKSIEDMIDEMLGNSGNLSPSELEWIKKIDRTTSKFKSLKFTQRQSEIVQDIYRKYVLR